MTPELTELLARARATVDAMTPDQRAEMYRQQRESWVVGEAGFGSDADEAAYRAAVQAGHAGAIAKLNEEAEERTREILNEMGDKHGG